jgi:hypothetical protein
MYCDQATTNSLYGDGECYEAIAYNHVYGLNNDQYETLYTVTVQAEHIYYVFLWDDQHDWGSRTVPATAAAGGNTTGSGCCNAGGFNVFGDPHPHQPTAIYPANGQQSAPVSFTLKWSSGIDAQRTWPGQYTTRYDIFGYGYGGSEVPVASNVFCNPDGSGYCTFPINALFSSTYYYWRVVAKLDSGWSPRSNPYLTQSSGTFTFTTLTNASKRWGIVGANAYNYVNAVYCGGSNVDVTGSSAGPCQLFNIVDINGGDLMSGDHIYLTINGFYLEANYGGGSGCNLANMAPSSTEVFTVEKTSGTPGSRILQGDRVTFKTSGSNYLVATYGGGADLEATSTTVNYWEIFSLAVEQ